MKRVDLVRQLREAGRVLIRHGRRHVIPILANESLHTGAQGESEEE